MAIFQVKFNFINTRMNMLTQKNVFFQIDEKNLKFQLISDVSPFYYSFLKQRDTPLITFIIPTYQRDFLFREALKSILMQREVPFVWEIIVVDNSEPDERGETPALRIIREFGDSRVQYYRNEQNLGMFGNWNRGVELAHGTWVSFLHDDDVLCPDALINLGRIIRFAKVHLPRLGYIHARRVEFSKNFDQAQAEKKNKSYLSKLTRTGALIRGWSQTGVPSCGTTILRQAYMETGGANSNFGGIADAILGYQIMKQYEVVISDRVLGGYRWLDNETLRKETLLNFVEADLLFARYRYSLTFWSRFFGLLFWRVHPNLNIEGKLELPRQGHPDMNQHDFDFIVPYKKSNIIVRFLYKLVQHVYHQIEKIGRIYISDKD